MELLLDNLRKQKRKKELLSQGRHVASKWQAPDSAGHWLPDSLTMPLPFHCPFILKSRGANFIVTLVVPTAMSLMLT